MKPAAYVIGPLFIMFGIIVTVESRSLLILGLGVLLLVLGSIPIYWLVSER
jgi:hypothetical protein